MQPLGKGWMRFLGSGFRVCFDPKPGRLREGPQNPKEGLGFIGFKGNSGFGVWGVGLSRCLVKVLGFFNLIKARATIQV